jgi:beta-phosphoglucomutase-like phosphatase (HAD superfamily)
MNHLDLSEIKSVIFDFDGLLVNSEDIISACWVKTCQHFGIDYPEGFFDDIVGVSKDLTYQSLCQYMDVVVEETDFFHQRALFIDEEVNKGNVKLLPGVDDFLKKLDRLGIPMYIATSSSRFWPIKITERLNISQYFRLSTVMKMLVPLNLVLISI